MLFYFYFQEGLSKIICYFVLAVGQDLTGSGKLK